MVVNWTNEEGARFAPAMLASGVFAGVHTQDYAYGRKDAEGKTLRRRAEAHRLDGRRAGRRSARCTPTSSTTSSRGRSSRPRTRRSASSPTARACGGSRSRSPARRPYRLDADADARQCRPRHGAHRRDGPRRSRWSDAAGARSAASARSSLSRIRATSSRARSSSPSTSARPSRRRSTRMKRQIEAEAPKICAELGLGCRDRGGRPFRSGDLRPGLRRGASATPPSGSATRTATSSPAPATTPAGSTASRRPR